MSEHLLEPVEKQHEQVQPGRRQQHGIEEQLVLTELAPAAVIDHLDEPEEAVDLITFGTVRETCPKCGTAHLKLVLRQRRVRLAHLFCPDCQSCYDARYPSGASALTI